MESKPNHNLPDTQQTDSEPDNSSAQDQELAVQAYQESEETPDEDKSRSSTSTQNLAV